VAGKDGCKARLEATTKSDVLIIFLVTFPNRDLFIFGKSEGILEKPDVCGKHVFHVVVYLMAQVPHLK